MEGMTPRWQILVKPLVKAHSPRKLMPQPFQYICSQSPVIQMGRFQSSERREFLSQLVKKIRWDKSREISNKWSRTKMLTLWVGVPAVHQDLTTEFGDLWVSLRDMSPGSFLLPNSPLHVCVVYRGSKWSPPSPSLAIIIITTVPGNDFKIWKKNKLGGGGGGCCFLFVCNLRSLGLCTIM